MLVFLELRLTELQGHDLLLLANPAHVVTRPFPFNTDDSNVSRLTITATTNADPDFGGLGYNFVEEYHENSVVGALSGVGGLGSLLSTVLVLLMGTSLMRALIRESSSRVNVPAHDTLTFIR